MRYPTDTVSHRDCCIGVSFPLVALEKYPGWKKKPARLIEAQKLLMELQGLLEVSRFSAGEKRALQASCEAAADAIDEYDAAHSQTRDAAYSAWCVMWFLGDEAFADAPLLWRHVEEEAGALDEGEAHHRPHLGPALPLPPGRS